MVIILCMVTDEDDDHDDDDDDGDDDMTWRRRWWWLWWRRRWWWWWWWWWSRLFMEEINLRRRWEREREREMSPLEWWGTWDDAKGPGGGEEGRWGTNCWPIPRERGFERGGKGARRRRRGMGGGAGATAGTRTPGGRRESHLEKDRHVSLAVNEDWHILQHRIIVILMLGRAVGMGIH